MALRLDPTTGLYVDDTTGHAYTDASGTQLSTNPGLNAQATRSLQLSNQLYSKLGQFQQGYNQAQAGQTQLGTALDQQIRGSGPSVAQTQLAQATEGIARQQDSQAAGVSGSNAALARYAAMQNTGDAQAQAAQAASSLRAQEVAQAEQAKGQVLAQQGQEANQGYASTITGATGAGNTAAYAGGTQAQIDEQNSQANKQLVGNVLNAVGGAGTALALKSDPKTKNDMEHVSDDDMKKLLDKISTFSFDYKDPGSPGEPPGHRIGVNAHDVEAGGPIGKAVVIKGKTLSLDTGNAIGAALAAVASLHRRIEALEGGK